MFEIDKLYKREDIYAILNVPKEKRKGEWNTGYREYEGNIFIFSNIAAQGRTGHDYNNEWKEGLFHWEAKINSSIHQPSIQKMITPKTGMSIFLFTRYNDRSPFSYEGRVTVDQYFDTSPVKIIWRLLDEEGLLSETIEAMPLDTFFVNEGGMKKVSVNRYERNPSAKKMCINHYGTQCFICGFDYEKQYGELGKGYIQVHHLIMISEFSAKYKLDPINDLIPVCANCHSIIHRKATPFTVDELKAAIRRRPTNDKQT